MAKFLNTSAANYYLEELIKASRERLYLISPYLQLNERIKELLEDKDRMKIDVRMVYGKSELQPDQANWLKNLQYIRTSYCPNLHAKCYISEAACIITSLNLYEFSQVNNNEMGVLILRKTDPDVYREAYEEASRIIRISDEVKISVDVIEKSADEPRGDLADKPHFLLSPAKLGEKYGLKTAEVVQKLGELGYLDIQGKNTFLTEAGKAAGGVTRKGQYGYFQAWPEDIFTPEPQA